jgi:ABC-type multidrug transport system, ATPase component
MEKIIEVFNFKKSYKNIQAVKGISFYVEKGKLFAFLGPNGAGKSTTIDTICTFLQPDSGTIMVDGHCLGAEDDLIRSKIGVVFQDGLLDPLLTIKENFEIRGSFYGLKGAELDKAITRVTKITGIDNLLKRFYGKLSGGQRRRCDIARALLHTPTVLFLDEPTTGLDPQTRKMLWETISKLQKDENMTIFLTTHYMEEAAEADYVIVIDNGEISAKGTPQYLKETYAKDLVWLLCSDLSQVKQILDEMQLLYSITESTISIKIEKTLDAIPILEACKDFLNGFEVISGTLDNAFIEITGKEIRE